MSEKDNLIPFKMHPRVFAALGADLVTNDVVAVIELVKNSYDAFAENVWIRFDEDEEGRQYVEVEDDGCGMSRDIIENVWCVVATPYRKENPYSVLGNKKRRVSGEKGLGRLSVARLGSELVMHTKPKDENCWRVAVNWNELAVESKMEACFIQLDKCKNKKFKSTGTILRIYGLTSAWKHEMLRDLRDNLARLLSPFLQKGNFNLYLQGGLGEFENLMKIDVPPFLLSPKYRIKGTFNKSNILDCEYSFKVASNKDGSESIIRKIPFNLSWAQIYEKISDKDHLDKLDEELTHCGPFDFEIRAWDLDADGIDEIFENFGIKKSVIRKIISKHKGVSVYRDGILVLPKSDNSIDWLGLDLRRVSKVGVRMSTSQIVGHVVISADSNPGIKDTSDREGLVNSVETVEFEAILKMVISLLENERFQDKTKPEREKPLRNLFDELSTDDFLSNMSSLANDGATVKETMPKIRSLSKKIDDARKTIQDRFVYYSRMATVGTIAQMLIHEIRNRTTAIDDFLKSAIRKWKPFPDEVKEDYYLAEKSILSLESLANRFMPLANRSFTSRRRSSNLAASIRDCLSLQEKLIENKGIECHLAKSVNVDVAVDPGELDTILLNLITNSIYWLSDVPEGKRRLEFTARKEPNGKKVTVTVDDTGPGIRDDIVDKVLWPGITKKPDGIGMGLTVASELVDEYGGQMLVKHPGTLGGASFKFDLPIKG